MSHSMQSDCLPADGGTLVGRAWLPEAVPGPAVIAVRAGVVFDLTMFYPTVSDLLNQADPLAIIDGAGEGQSIGPAGALLANSHWDRRDPGEAFLLAPCDLQAVKACGVTFFASLLERVIEEKAGGDPARADDIRRSLAQPMGSELGHVKPGSPQARELKQILVDRGMWSAYLEVAIGPDAEVFTKAQPLAAVGHGMEIGIHPESEWNNPEPEIVLAVNRDARAVGATLGNDVNLRDVEGRSALLLGRAKDNNGSCAVGPLIRLFDDSFGMDDLRRSVVTLRVTGEDAFAMTAESNMAEISRDPLELVAQTINAHHHYPDGLMLFLGTPFAPVQDRDAAGLGFTHKAGDIVEISSPRLGRLINRVNDTDRIPPWDFGIRQLMTNLARRGVL